MDKASATRVLDTRGKPRAGAGILRIRTAGSKAEPVHRYTLEFLPESGSSTGAVAAIVVGE